MQTDQHLSLYIHLTRDAKGSPTTWFVSDAPLYLGNFLTRRLKFADNFELPITVNCGEN